MKVRKFKPQDAKEVSRILYKAFKTFLGNKINRGHFSPENLGGNVKGKDYEAVSFVAEENGKILGYISGSAHKRGLGSLGVVGVRTDVFHKEVGAALIKALEKFWKRKKLRKVSTCVSAHNKRALMYYLKHDFIPVGYQKDHFFAGVDEIILDRFLK